LHEGKAGICTHFQIRVSYFYKFDFYSSYKNNLVRSPCMRYTFMFGVSLTILSSQWRQILFISSVSTSQITFVLETQQPVVLICVGTHSFFFCGSYETCVNRISGLLILRQVLHTQTNFMYAVTNFMAKGFRRQTYM
jgi:hypothetical protein